MQQIDWNKLGLKGESKQKSFEDLCMYLFCRELKAPKISAYQNHPGIETDPVEVNGKKYGFQSKFFDSKFDWEQIKKSIEKAIDNYPELDKIYLYSNKDKTMFRGKETKIESEINKKAATKNIKIEYVMEKTLLQKLSEPSNFDLAQLFFGIGDEFSFIKKSVDTKMLTFIQSSEYIELPVVDVSDNKVEKVSEDILTKEQKVFLILGNPGSGKSVLINKILQTFGGLDKETKTEMREVLTQNNAVPVLINLKNCTTDSFENIIRNRKNDSKVNNQELNFIYLFDGLDELSEEIADNVLFQIYELSQRSNTKKIIFSCRRGNLNRSKAKVYFSDIVEYQIADLDLGYIDKFFKVKKDTIKEEYYEKLKEDNSNLINEIKDILLIKLLWDTIIKLDKNSGVLDLFSEKIDLLIDNPSHRKNIEELNLLNPKKEAIIEINQDISFEYQKKFQFNFSQKDLQEIILNKYKRLDYKDVNVIINYITDLFFESSHSENDNDKAMYVYQHRRYQEYFLTRRLKDEYEKNPKILRDLKILSNREYFEELFLKYLKRGYIKENNLAGLIELNLLNIYLGKSRKHGIVVDYCSDSHEFIPALLCQEQSNFDNLVEGLKIIDRISPDMDEINNQFTIWEDSQDYYSTDYLTIVWEEKIASLIKNIAEFWKGGKEEKARYLIEQLKEVINLYEEKNFLNKLYEADRGQLRDPFGEELESWIYYQLMIKKENVKDIFNKLIRTNVVNSIGEEAEGFVEAGEDELVKSFFSVCLSENKQEIFEMFDDFNEHETMILLKILIKQEHIHIFVRQEFIHTPIKSFVEKLSYDVINNNVFILFYKKFFNMKISEEELEKARLELPKYKKSRIIDWNITEDHNEFALFSFILDEYSFEKELVEQDFQLQLHNALYIYASLFREYILLLKKEKELGIIIRDYIRYRDKYFDVINNSQNFKLQFSYLWASIFSNSDIDKQLLVKWRNILIKQKYFIIPFDFYKKLQQLNSKTFNDVIDREQLELIEIDSFFGESDFYSYINICFGLSKLFSTIDNETSKFYFEKGMNEGILRHGWHKDVIVSYFLTGAFKIIWRNNWLSKKDKQKYAKKVFELNLRLADITDGDHTRQGPYFVVEIVSENDIKLAEEFKEVLEKNGKNENSILTLILISKANQGLQIEEIQEGMQEYNIEYDFEGKPRAQYYEEQIKVYLAITKCDLYTDEEKKLAFEKAYEQAEKIKHNSIKYAFFHRLSSDEKQTYRSLCEKYGREFNLGSEKDEKNKEKPKKTEFEFGQEVKFCKNAEQIQERYKQLEDYNNRIVLKEYKSWESLVKKTYEINGDIQVFLGYLKKNHYPDTDHWTLNSDFFHMGLAAALKNLDTRQETLNYLYEHSGHGGFVNIMKAYEIIGDKDKCVSLFNRYIKFCELIVN
ncbi:NACHT domain-containing protein [Bacillus thuringiensis]|uniref:NACHT domain-containing protein n=3 Tax=Bacillus thuringiensis TaxID=1428 RepID=UPI003262F375